MGPTDIVITVQDVVIIDHTVIMAGDIDLIGGDIDRGIGGCGIHHGGLDIIIDPGIIVRLM